MTKKEEVKLLEELKKGNEEALATIFKLWRRDVFKSARSIVDNDQDAMDIQQLVFITLWERRERLKIADLRTYLQAAARNMALNHLKKGKNDLAKLQKISIQQDVIQSPPEYGELPQNPSAENKLMTALDQMPERRASIFKQVIFEGKTLQMVADSEQIEVSTVRSHLQKAGAQLRELLKKKS